MRVQLFQIVWVSVSFTAVVAERFKESFLFDNIVQKLEEETTTARSLEGVIACSRKCPAFAGNQSCAADADDLEEFLQCQADCGFNVINKVSDCEILLEESTPNCNSSISQICGLVDTFPAEGNETRCIRKCVDEGVPEKGNCFEARKKFVDLVLCVEDCGLFLYETLDECFADLVGDTCFACEELFLVNKDSTTPISFIVIGTLVAVLVAVIVYFDRSMYCVGRKPKHYMASRKAADVSL